MRRALSLAVVGLVATTSSAGGVFDGSVLVQSPVEKHGAAKKGIRKSKQPQEVIANNMGEDKPHIKQSREELQREQNTRKAIREMVNSIPLPTMMKVMMQGQAITALMKVRRDLDPQSRLFFDNVVAFKGFKAHTIEGLFFEVGTFMVNSGFKEMGEHVIDMVQAGKTVSFLSQTFSMVAAKLSKTGLGTKSDAGVDLHSLAQVVREMSLTKEMPKVEDPVPPMVVGLKDFVLHGKKELDDVAAIIDERAKNPKEEWASATQLAGRGNIATTANISALAEVLLWVADTSRTDLKNVNIFHELTLMMQDVVTDIGVNLTKPATRFLTGAADLSKDANRDLSPLLSLATDFFADSGFMPSANKEVAGEVAKEMQKHSDPHDLQTLVQKAASIPLLVQAVSLFDWTHPRAGARAVTRLVSASMPPPAEEAESMNRTKVMRDVAVILRNVEGLNVTIPVYEQAMALTGVTPVLGKAVADFLDRQAQYIDEGHGYELDHVLPSMAWMFEDIQGSSESGSPEAISQGPISDVILELFKNELLFTCNLESVRSNRTECEGVAKVVRPGELQA